MGPLIIPFSGFISIQEIERILKSYYYKSKMKKFDKVIFKFSTVEWISFYATSQLLSWVMALLKRNIKVNIELDNFSEQVQKNLIDYGVLNILKAKGANVNFYNANNPESGFPFDILHKTELNSTNSLWDRICRLRDNFISENILKPFEETILNEVFDIIIKEVLENSIFHSKSKETYFGIGISTSSAESPEQTYLTQLYPKGVRYIEICIGDNGDGIIKTLSPNYRSNYKLPYTCALGSLTESDKIASYSFDFFSTSDKSSREERISNVIALNVKNPISNNTEDRKILPHDIATGLFCVLRVIQDKFGQIILRNPDSLISVNYYGLHNTSGILHNSKKINMKGLSNKPGSHFTIRIPLIIKKKVNDFQYENPNHIIDFSKIHVFDPFDIKQTDHNSKIIESSINKINTYIKNLKNEIEGLVIIPTPYLHLQSREIAAFIAGLQLMTADKYRFVWSFKTAKTIFEIPDKVSREYADNSLPIVFFGDIFSNIFSSKGNSDKFIDDWFRVDSKNSQLRSLDIDVIQEIYKQFIVKLNKKIKQVITSSSVLYTSGLYLIEKKYYTEKFYQITSLLDDSYFLKLCAIWTCIKLNLHNQKIENIIVISKSVIGIAEHLQSLLEDSSLEINILDVSDEKTYDGIKRKTKRFSNSKSLILTNVICRGETIKRYINPLTYRLDIVKIVTIVDARKIVSKIHEIDVLSIHQDEIVFYEDHDDIPKNNKAKEIYLIDEKTISPTLRIRPTNEKFRALQTTKKTYRNIVKSNSLISQHVEFKNNHFSLFFNLNKFFQSMDSQIKNQISILINEINIKKDMDTILKVFFFDPEDDLSFLQDFILFEFIPIQNLTMNDLEAPDIPERVPNKKLKCLIITPASINGTIARLCIEYVSRFHPKEIYFHSILSSMESRHQSFMQSITMYSNIKLVISFSLEVRLPAFNKHNCPICFEKSKFENIHDKVDDKLLKQLLFNKIRSLDVLDMNEPDNYNQDFETNFKMVKKLEIRTLYLSSAFDIKSRRKLSKIFNSDRKTLYYLSELINDETLSEEFSKNNIQFRLYNDYDKFIIRLLGILEQDDGKIDITKHLNTMMHLIPDETIFRINHLFTKYAHSLEVIEEICLVLILNNKIFNYEPNLFHKSKRLNNNIMEKVLKTIDATKKHILSEKEKEKFGFTENKVTIDPFIDLCASLIRSERFFRDRMEKFSLKLKLSKKEIESLKNVDSEWSEFFKIINNLRMSEIGSNILDIYTIYNECLYKISKLVKKIREQANLFDNISENTIIVSVIQQSFIQIKKEIKKLKKQNLKLKFRPGDFYSFMGNKLITKKGKEIEIINLPTKNEERRKLPSWVFGDMDRFMNLFDGIKNNWCKYCEEITSPLIFNISEQNQSVHFEFIDNCNGTINKESMGTIEQIKNYCKTYGCTYEIDNNFIVNDKKCHCIRISMIIIEE